MQRGTITLHDSLDIFLLDCESRRLTKSTRQFYRAKLSVFIAWCDSEGIQELGKLGAHDIRRFLVHNSAARTVIPVSAQLSACDPRLSCLLCAG